MILSGGTSALELLEDDVFNRHGVRVFVKREDQIHPFVSGNKWRKLKYNLEGAVAKGYNKIVTFGGAYSNHIHALAFASKEIGMPCRIIVRGERTEPLNPTLKDVQSFGASIDYMSRDEYRRRNERSILEKIGVGSLDYLVPEGGTNLLAVQGVKEMVGEIDIPFDLVMSPVGTGGTIAGIAEGLPINAKAVGVVVLKGAEGLSGDIAKLTDSQSWSLVHDYHFGGYAKSTSEIVDFINWFSAEKGIQLDPIYTGKMFFALFDMIRNGKFDGKTVVAVHTGGLQGIRGFNQRFGNLIHQVG